jgi:hypothetical protein
VSSSFCYKKKIIISQTILRACENAAANARAPLSRHPIHHTCLFTLLPPPHRRVLLSFHSSFLPSIPPPFRPAKEKTKKKQLSHRSFVCVGVLAAHATPGSAAAAAAPHRAGPAVEQAVMHRPVPDHVEVLPEPRLPQHRRRSVAAYIEFESKLCETSFSLYTFIGSSVETRRFQPMGQLTSYGSTCTAPHRVTAHREHLALLQPVVVVQAVAATS